jgi:hypothetical protein
MLRIPAFAILALVLLVGHLNEVPASNHEQTWYFSAATDSLFELFTLDTFPPDGNQSDRVIIGPLEDHKWKSDWAIHDGYHPPFELKPTSWLISLWLASSEPVQLQVSIGYWVACFTCNITGAPKLITSGNTPAITNPLGTRSSYTFVLHSNQTTIPAAAQLATEVAMYVVIANPSDSAVEFFIGGVDTASFLQAAPATPIPEYETLPIILMAVMILVAISWLPLNKARRNAPAVMYPVESSSQAR